MAIKIDLSKHFDRAEAMLKEKKIQYIRKDDMIPNVIESHMIKSKETDEKGIPKWDFICATGSYGAEHDLLEYWSRKMEKSKLDPDGWLTAEEVLAKIEAGD